MIVSLWPSFQFVIEDKVMKEYYEKYLRDNTTTVKQGQWINPHWQSSIHCMNCNQCKYEAQHSVHHGVEKYYHYCPNCGAKMDKGE